MTHSKLLNAIARCLNYIQNKKINQKYTPILSLSFIQIICNYLHLSSYELLNARYLHSKQENLIKSN